MMTYIKIIFFTLLFCLIGGVAAADDLDENVRNTPQSSAPRYDYKFDKMSAQDRYNVKQAMKQWEAVTGVADLFDGTSDDPMIVFSTAISKPGASKQSMVLATTRGNGADYTTITMYQSKLMLAYRNSTFSDFNKMQVAAWAHEIGHALGLGHSDNKDDLMYPSLMNDEQHITQADLLELPWTVSSESIDQCETHAEKKTMYEKVMTQKTTVEVRWVYVLGAMILGMLVAAILLMTIHRR